MLSVLPVSFFTRLVGVVKPPLPTHEIVAVFPGQIKPGEMRIPVRMHGALQTLSGSRTVMLALRDSITEALNRPLVHPVTNRPTQYQKALPTLSSPTHSSS